MYEGISYYGLKFDKGLQPQTNEYVKPEDKHVHIYKYIPYSLLNYIHL